MLYGIGVKTHGPGLLVGDEGVGGVPGALRVERDVVAARHELR